METAVAILLVLCIFVFIPLIIGVVIGRIMVAADRRNRSTEKTGVLPATTADKNTDSGFPKSSPVNQGNTTK